MVGLGADCAATRANGENTARLARALLKNSAAVRGSGLKMATDVVGMLGHPKPQQKRGRSFSPAGMEIDGGLLAWEGWHQQEPKWVPLVPEWALGT